METQTSSKYLLFESTSTVTLDLSDTTTTNTAMDVPADEAISAELRTFLNEMVEAQRQTALRANTTFVIFCAALVFLMTAGLGFFYSGMARSSAALSMILICFLSMAVVLIQWMVFGSSLAFSEYANNGFIGDFAYGGARKVGDTELKAAVSSTAFFLYHGMYAAFTPALIFGSCAERVRAIPACIFIFLWTTIVYDPVAYWIWGANGFLRKLGSIDFAGGTPIHVTSGFSGLAVAIVLGKRAGYDDESKEWKPNNIGNVFLGTALLWFGSFGFNSGPALAGTSRAAMSCIATSLAAASSGLTWVFFDYRRGRKLSGISFCCGAVVGLVGITPGSGFVVPWAAIVIGFLVGLICNVGSHLKFRLHFDDALDVFSTHGLGGFFGNILCGIFAQKWVAKLDGTVIEGGWMDQHWMQVPYQLAACASVAAWSFTITFIIAFLMKMLPMCSLRLKESDEELGMDLAVMGESDAIHNIADISAIAWMDAGHSAKVRKRILRKVFNPKTGNQTWKRW